MTRPYILAVDDDGAVLDAVRSDLRDHYGDDYQVLAETSGADALATLEELRLRGHDVAVFVVDQRMPAMSGTEFLLAAQALYPDAKRVLLTAYADTQAAIHSINEVGLDHYLLKPWDPPEELLYPILDDLLEDWVANHPPPFEGIRVLGTRWAPESHDARDFLARNQIPYRFLDVERDSDARALLDALPADERTLPVLLFPDGPPVSRPSPRDIAARAGLTVQASGDFHDVIVIGAGPAGLAAAVYGASEGLRVAVLEHAATGGQAGTSSRIENYLGFPNGIAGADLARRAAAQAQRFGAEILTAAEVVKVEADDAGKRVHLSDGSVLAAHAVVIASGMTVRRLDVPGYERLTGAGVYYGATLSEATTYRDEDVFVVGAANSAGQGAVLFSRHARSVTILVRGTSLQEGMSQYLIDQIDAIDNIEVLTQTEVTEVRGDGHLEMVVTRGPDGVVERPGSGLFIFVGALPHSDFVADLVARNQRGFILTGPDLMVDGARPPGWTLDRDPYLLETSVPGVFAAGDVREGAVRRVASAVGQGSICISMVHQYLATE